eukprot:757406-Hanusia_phi.AAC.2
MIRSREEGWEKRWLRIVRLSMNNQVEAYEFMQQYILLLPPGSPETSSLPSVRHRVPSRRRRAGVAPCFTWSLTSYPDRDIGCRMGSSSTSCPQILQRET